MSKNQSLHGLHCVAWQLLWHHPMQLDRQPHQLVLQLVVLLQHLLALLPVQLLQHLLLLELVLRKQLLLLQQRKAVFGCNSSRLLLLLLLLLLAGPSRLQRQQDVWQQW
jgi:hypothetical protein